MACQFVLTQYRIFQYNQKLFMQVLLTFKYWNCTLKCFDNINILDYNGRLGAPNDIALIRLQSAAILNSIWIQFNLSKSPRNHLHNKIFQEMSDLFVYHLTSWRLLTIQKPLPWLDSVTLSQHLPCRMI